MLIKKRQSTAEGKALRITPLLAISKEEIKYGCTTILEVIEELI